MIRVAFASIPKDGGTFSAYRNLRAPLSKHDIDLLCCSVGRDEKRQWQDEFADDGCVKIAPDISSTQRQARAFSQWCDTNHIDIVIGLNSGPVLSALPHLSSRIRVVARCANSFEHGYRITMACAPRISKIIALAPVQAKQLTDTYGASASRIELIPNGVDSRRFAIAPVSWEPTQRPIRLGFLGRLEHGQKGVMFIPAVLRGLVDNGIDFEMTIAGRGIHDARLRADLRAKGLEQRVRFIGALDRAQVPDFLAQTDVLIFPSLFEGSPNVLLEGMAAGCLVVAWRIEGLIDFLIDHELTGLLAERGNTDDMAKQVISSMQYPENMQKIRNNAAHASRDRFSLERMADRYAHVFHEVMSESVPSFDPLPWTQFELHPEFHSPAWRRWVPRAFKLAYKRQRARWKG